jgi:hypothetical protein
MHALHHKPTLVEYTGLQAADDHFRTGLLFGVDLPDVMIVLTRPAHSLGHFRTAVSPPATVPLTPYNRPKASRGRELNSARRVG